MLRRGLSWCLGFGKWKKTLPVNISIKAGKVKQEFQFTAKNRGLNFWYCKRNNIDTNNRLHSYNYAGWW